MNEADSRSSSIEFLQSTSLADLVQQAVLQRIRDGKLLGGDRVNEGGLASELAISRGPVREALRSLMGDGLIQVQKNRGFFVGVLSLEEANEIYRIRGALDRLAGATLASIVTADQVSSLRSLVKACEAAAKSGDYSGYYQVNLRFHKAIVVFSGNQRLAQLSQKLTDQLHLLRRGGLFSASSMQASLSEHRAIIQSIEARNPIAAGKAMEEHVLAGWERARESVSVLSSDATTQRVGDA